MIVSHFWRKPVDGFTDDSQMMQTGRRARGEPRGGRVPNLKSPEGRRRIGLLGACCGLGGAIGAALPLRVDKRA